MKHDTACGRRAASVRRLALAACLAAGALALPATAADSYGPVQPGESLGIVAQKLRPDPAIPLKRVMQALYHANRDAFVNGDIQQLMVGSTLQVPDLGALPRTPLATPMTELAGTPPETGAAPATSSSAPFPTVAANDAPPAKPAKPATAAPAPPPATAAPAAAPPAAPTPAPAPAATPPATAASTAAAVTPASAAAPAAPPTPAVPPAPAAVPLVHAVPATTSPPAQPAASVPSGAPAVAPAAAPPQAPLLAALPDDRHSPAAVALREQLNALAMQNAEIRVQLARSDAETQRMRADFRSLQEQGSRSPMDNTVLWLGLLLMTGLVGFGIWWWPRRPEPAPAAAPAAAATALAHAPPAAGGGAAPAADSARPIFSTDPVATGLDWLSVLHTLGDADRFREEVQNLLLQPELRSRPEWRTIRALGRDLLPHDPLFTAAADEEAQHMSPREPLPPVLTEPPTTGPYPALSSEPTPALPLRLGIPASHQAALMVADRRGITGRYTALTDDEVGTKLALAHVYLDHGDFDNARAMLLEVTEGQHPGYSQEARALMEAIARRPAAG